MINISLSLNIQTILTLFLISLTLRGRYMVLDDELFKSMTQATTNLDTEVESADRQFSFKFLKPDLFNVIVEAHRLKDDLTDNPVLLLKDSNIKSIYLKYFSKEDKNDFKKKGREFNKLFQNVDLDVFRPITPYSDRIYTNNEKSGYFFEMEQIRNLEDYVQTNRPFNIVSMLSIYGTMLTELSVHDNHTNNSYCSARAKSFGIDKNNRIKMFNFSFSSYRNNCHNTHMQIIPPENIKPTSGFEYVMDKKDPKNTDVDAYGITISFLLLFRINLKAMRGFLIKLHYRT